MSYPNPHLRLTETRGATLFNALKPHLQLGDTVYDVCCGYSPLAQHIIEYGCHITGVDIHPDPIKELKEEHPNETWVCKRIEDCYGSPRETPFTVLLLLGPDTPQASTRYQGYLRSLVKAWRPHTVMMDTWMDGNAKFNPHMSCPVKTWHKAYNCNLTTLLAMGYRVEESGVYDADIDLPENDRYYVILRDDVMIRGLEKSDRVKVLQMLNECGEETRYLFRPIRYFYNLEGVNWFFKTLDGLDARRFVADNGNGEVLGIIYYYVKDGGAFLGVLVADAYQRMGIGNRLVEAVEEDALKRGIPSISTGGGTLDGGPLHGLLMKRGYVFSYWKSDTHRMMEKKLNPLGMSIGKVEGSGMGKDG